MVQAIQSKIINDIHWISHNTEDKRINHTMALFHKVKIGEKVFGCKEIKESASKSMINSHRNRNSSITGDAVEIIGTR